MIALGSVREPKKMSLADQATPGSARFVDIEGPNAELRRIHLDEAEAIKARNARPGIDVPAVGGARDPLHGLVPVHERTQALDGSVPMPADDLGRSPEAKQRVVNDRRRCGREQAQRVGPRTARRLGVDDPDRTVCGLDRDRKRHGLERGAPARMLAPRETEKPSGPSRRLRAGPRPEPAQHRTIVVAQHNGVEASLKPSERFVRMRAPVDKIPNAEESIHPRIEPDRAQGAIKGAKTPVHIADDEIAAARIDAPRRTAHGHGHETGERAERAPAGARARSRGARALQRRHRSRRASQIGDMRR